jgi:prepilin-type N-terminal cleavage/methylation domain-containing protein
MVRPVELMSPVRARRQIGFTLVELMVVVTIVGVVGMLASRMYSRGVRGEQAPGFARSLMSTMLDARHIALTLGRPSRVTLIPASPAMLVKTESLDPADGTNSTWLTQTTTTVPSSLQLCAPVNQTVLTTWVPTCPLTSGADRVICFWPNGRVSLPSGGVCQTTSPSTGTGATIYFGTRAGDKKFRLVVWGLTGMTKLIDQW